MAWQVQTLQAAYIYIPTKSQIYATLPQGYYVGLPLLALTGNSVLLQTDITAIKEGYLIK